MKKPFSMLGFLLLLAGGVILPESANASVVAQFFNSESLLDNDLTELSGTISSGDFIQIIAAGANGIIDIPDAFGNPSGDDTLLTFISGNNLTHVGANETSGNWNLGLFNETVTYSESLVGQGAYLRFFNAFSASLATFYGETVVTNVLGANPLFPELPVELDFVSNTSFSRIANTIANFSATSVPEPHLLIPAFLILGCILRWKRWMQAGSVWAVLLLYMPADPCQAQLAPSLYVSATVPVQGLDGSPLPGSNPLATSYGYTSIPGALIQVIDAGSDQQANFPDVNGNPTGDDVVLFTISIGEGVAPNLSNSGQLSQRIYPGPPQGSILYARAFNAASVTSATHWTQSTVFEVTGSQVMDLTALGLWRTTLPIGVDITLSDSDGDGVSDADELVANTDASDGSEVFSVEKLLQGSSVQVSGKSGRNYILQRSVDPLTEAMNWEDIAESGVLTADRDVFLVDPAPPSVATGFYRLKAQTP